jgi:hypothetical protein
MRQALPASEASLPQLGLTLPRIVALALLALVYLVAIPLYLPSRTTFWA